MIDVAISVLLRDAYLTGWAVAAPIGPVNLEIIRRGLRHGVVAGLMVGLGAVVVDGSYMLLFSTGLKLLTGVSVLMAALHLLGGGFLSWLGVQALREAWRLVRKPDGEAALTESEASPPRIGPWYASFLVGLGMTASNPMTIAFWSALSLQFTPLPLTYRLLACGAVLAGCLSWVTLITLIVAFARRLVGPRLFSAVTFLGGSIILLYGIVFVWRGVLMIQGLSGGE